MRIDKFPKIKEYKKGDIKGDTKTILITGGAGFVGHHAVEGVLKNTNWDIIVLDRLDLSGNLHRLIDIDVWEEESNRVSFIWWDLKSPINFDIEADYVWHLAASSHVDRSIEDPVLFAMDNVVGTTNLLNACRKFEPEKIIYFSTDEVFGPAPDDVEYKEWDRYNSGNPYAASKAGGEEMAVAFANTYGLNIMITHTMNVGGERQHPEKFIPMCIRKIRDGETVTIHANEDKTVSGSRYYIHARNVCDALLYLMEFGECLDGSGEEGKYNIVGEREVSNLELAEMIADSVGKELKYEMVDFHSSRPGHDLRYALDGDKMKDLGWVPPKETEEWIDDVVKWSLKNPQWLE